MEELDKTMYFKAKPDILEAARILRKSMTIREKLLWDKLKEKQICDCVFADNIQLSFLLLIFIAIK